MSKQLRRSLEIAQTVFNDMKSKSQDRYREQAAQEDAIKMFMKSIMFEEKLLTESTWLLKLHGEHVRLHAMPGTFSKLRELIFSDCWSHTAFKLTPDVSLLYDDGDLSIIIENGKALDFLKNEGVKVNIGYIGAGMKELEKKLTFLKGLQLMFKDMEV